MKKWFGRASSIFVGMVAALSLLALPTYTWLTRELDLLHKMSGDNSQALTRIELTLTAVDKRTEESSRINTEALEKSGVNQRYINLLAANLAGDNGLLMKTLATNLPNNVFTEFEAAQKTDYLRAVQYQDDQFIYLERGDLAKFTLSERQVLSSLEELGGPKFIIWDQDEFPGHNFKGTTDFVGFE